jgi:hypothetical protein
MDIQAYIDDSHRVLSHALSTEVEVDTRFSLGNNGIYQEPLERALEYLGLSMHKDQAVNTSIDGTERKRALIPGHVLNAKLWYDTYTCDPTHGAQLTHRRTRCLCGEVLCAIKVAKTLRALSGREGPTQTTLYDHFAPAGGAMHKHTHTAAHVEQAQEES